LCNQRALQSNHLYKVSLHLEYLCNQGALQGINLNKVSLHLVYLCNQGELQSIILHQSMSKVIQSSLYYSKSYRIRPQPNHSNRLIHLEINLHLSSSSQFYQIPTDSTHNYSQSSHS